MNPILMKVSPIASIKRFIEWSGRLVSWLSLLMVLVTFTVVILRYVFDTGSIALQESITYLHASIFLIGAAWTLQLDAHVRVDIFYTKFSEDTRAWIDLIGSLFLLLPVMVFISWISWDYISDSWAVTEGSRESGGLPGVFLLKSLILIFTALLMLQGIVQAVEAMLKVINPTTSEASKH